jgi:hypothetical protein
MTKYKTVVLVLPLVFGLTALTVPRQSGNSSSSVAEPQRKAVDLNNFPIVSFSAAEQTDAQRKARGEKRNKSTWNVHSDDPSDSTVKVDSVDVHLPALPTEQASAIVIGTDYLCQSLSVER